MKFFYCTPFVLFLLLLHAASLKSAQTFQLTLNPDGSFVIDNAAAEAFGLAVDLKMQKENVRAKEEETKNLMWNDMQWMHELQLLLSEKDKDTDFNQIELYSEYLVKEGRPPYSGEFYPGSLEKAKSLLKERIKERIDKAYRDELKVKNYTPEIQKKDNEILQLKKDKEKLEKRLEENFIIKKSELKDYAYMLCFVGLIIFAIRFLWQKKRAVFAKIV